MVRCINVHNVNQGLAEGLRLLATSGLTEASRNGPVLVAREPVITTYLNPNKRVLFSPLRDANPFFHVMEALWMLAGRNDLPWLAQFNKNMLNYSDDGGKTQPGAYGFRWRRHFLSDQLKYIAELLREQPNTRRAVLGMWDVEYDLDNVNVSADVPCNTQAYFDVRDGKLNMTVTCRSNDIWWGAYGANAVHFSFLLEYMAAMVGVEVGVYRQFSNNFHLYPEKIPGYAGDKLELEQLSDDARNNDSYTLPAGPHTARTREPERQLKLVPLVTNSATFDDDLRGFMKGAYDSDGYENTFFGDVTVPMRQAWLAYKQGDYRTAIDHAEHIKAGDWSIACVEWLERRHARKLLKERTT